MEKMKRWEHFIKQALCYTPVDHKVHKKRDIVLEDGNVYDQFKDPMQVIARHALGLAEEYNKGISQRRYLHPAI